MKIMIKFVFLILLFGFSSKLSYGQFIEDFGNQGTFKVVRGQIQDGAETSVTTAVILATNVNTKKEFRSESDKNGNFKFVKLPSGKYTFRVEAVGFNITEFSLSLNSKNSKALRKFIIIGLSPGCASGGFGIMLADKIKKSQ